MDEMSGAFVGLAALCGLAIGRAWGGYGTERVLLNDREYMRAQLAAVYGENYQPPNGGGETAAFLRFPNFGQKQKEAA